MPSPSRLRLATGLAALGLALSACAAHAQPVPSTDAPVTAGASGVGAPSPTASASPTPASTSPTAPSPTTTSAVPVTPSPTSSPAAAPSTTGAPALPGTPSPSLTTTASAPAPAPAAAPASPGAASSASTPAEVSPSPTWSTPPTSPAPTRPTATRAPASPSPTWTRPAAPVAPRPAASAPTPSAARPGGRVDCTEVKCIALTFDDGPGKYTGRLLDILAAKHVPATFYLVGRSVQQHPEFVAREVAEGHQVGNHSFDHPLLTNLDAAGVTKEIRDDEAVIRAAGGVPSTVRPPYGAVDASVLATLGTLPRAGAVLWSVDTLDWQHRNPARTLAAVKAAAAPGAIVLMHDIHPTTVDAVPAVIDWLRAQGYTFVTVDTITGGVAPGTVVHHGLHP